MSRRAVTAIIVSFHTGPRLKECLYALSTDPDIERIVLVDNGNPAEMRAWIKRFATDRDYVDLLHPGENLGFGAAVNFGAKATTTPHLLIINPDAVLRRGSIKPMQETASALKTPWIVGGRIYDLNGHEERGPRRRELTLWRALTYFLGRNTWTLERTPPPDKPISMPVISGAFFLTSKQSFDSLEGFDERYFLHFEDVDLCQRCRASGGKVIYDPRAGALHYGATSDAPANVIAGHKLDSFERYFRVHKKGILARASLAVLLPMIRGLSALKQRKG